MDTEKIITKIMQSKYYCGQIIHVENIKKKEPFYSSLKEPLHYKLQEYLKKNNIDKLYIHQTAAVENVRKGENIVVVTPTASGKTLCYNLPVLENILNKPGTKALYIFPTKSLSQDQLSTVKDFNSGVKAFIYDGDTPNSMKGNIRENADIIITNPDMLHQGILPNHLKWSSFLSNLKYVVIDELHGYRGVFGTHAAHIIRRLRRICRHYESCPQFIMCSATIANPCEHAERLIGLPVTLTANNGAPQGNKKIILWKPPFKRPYINDAIWIFALLISLKTKTITFTRARQTTERIVRKTKNLLLKKYPLNNYHNKAASYRGGYLKEERRAIEKKLFNGDLHGVVSTNALELGIDVGDLQVCIIAGYPGTIASTWQQAGRAGRKYKDSLVIFIAAENPLDKFFIKNKKALFIKTAEQALIALENPYILMGHALCCAHELPIKKEDFALWGNILSDLLLLLEEDQKIVESDGTYYYIGEKYPAAEFNIRTSSLTGFQLRDNNSKKLIAVMDGHRALSETYPGAVYIHRGETFVVSKMDLENKISYLNKVDVDYYTMVKRDKETEIIEVCEKKQYKNQILYNGSLKVTSKVKGFVKKHEITGEVLGKNELELPEEIMETKGMWITFNDKITKEIQIKKLDLMGGLHAIEHAAIGLLPIFAMCDRNDLGGLSILIHPQTKLPTVFIHDAYDGGVGFSLTAYNYFEDLIKKTYDTISNCDCENGCPSCIYSPKCSNFNRPLDKKAAVYILKLLLE